MEPMRKVRNVGIAALFVPFGPYEGVNVPQGEVAEVPSRLADGLLEQPTNWQAVDDEPPKRESKAAEAKPSPKRKDGD